MFITSNNLLSVLQFTLSLSQYADMQCYKYSGGNKRKLSAAIALVGTPEVLLLVSCCALQERITSELSVQIQFQARDRCDTGILRTRFCSAPDVQSLKSHNCSLRFNARAKDRGNKTAETEPKQQQPKFVFRNSLYHTVWEHITDLTTLSLRTSQQQEWIRAQGGNSGKSSRKWNRVEQAYC